MNRIIRAFAAFIVSICLILAPAISYAASPSGWAVSPADIIINGISATVTAIKGTGSSALQSTVQHAPTVGNIGKKIIKIGGGAAAVYAITELLGAGVDWVLDPANNRVIYYDTTNGGTGSWYYEPYGKPKVFVVDPAADCVAFGGVPDFSVQVGRPAMACRPLDGTGVRRWYYQDTTIEPVEKYLPISTVAAKVQSNAAAGHAPSQDLIKSVIIDDVNNGYIDNKLNLNAVPIADAPPVIPPYDPTQPVPPFDPSSIIAAIKSVMAAVVNMSGVLGAKIDALMVDIGLKHDQQMAADAINTAEIVAANDRTGAKVAEVVAAIQAIEGNNLSAEDINAAVQSVIDANAADTQSVIDANAANTAAISAAIEAIEGNTLDGQVINDAIDRAIAAGNANAGDIVAAVEAIEGNTLDGQVINDAVDRVIANDNVKVGDIVAAIEAIDGNTLDGQVINDAVDRVIANDNANAQAAADAANTAAEAAKAADAANTAAVTDAIDAQTDAISETDPVTGEMSLKFPKFCSWALPVCTFTDWAMADPQLEEPEDTRPEIQDLTKYDTVDISQNYITATGQCPPAVDLNINFGVVKLSYEPLCLILDKLSGVIVAVAYISAGFMIVRTV